MNDIVFYTPVKLTSVNIDRFIQIANPIFSYKEQSIPNVTFNTNTTTKLDLVGSLLIYKFIEYTVHKHCFKNPKSVIEGYVKEELEKRLLKKFVDTFIKYKTPQYNQLKFSQTETLFISPILLKKDSKEDEIAIAGKDICNYYKDNEDIKFLILTCMGEIGLNFKAHAEFDTHSILSVAGTKCNFEIACVDTGIGIITSLSKTLKDKGIKCSKDSILAKALERGVSSKNLESGHMGYGLWLLKEIVLAVNGDFCIYSEGYCVICHRSRIKFKKCNYWQGTIAYVKLPLSKSSLLKDIMKQLRQQNTNIRIRKS